eukprot:GEMP01028707.1.p1 GENE.GEMP01028707.1~~GEMP01028707.1.p1  ORF type:complete len:207 (-),score=20.83 GEMP01028707.1:1556-2176(-)
MALLIFAAVVSVQGWYCLVSNCLRCKPGDNFKCHECNSGFVLNSQDECDSCEAQNCSVCVSPYQYLCEVCNSGFILNSQNGCDKSCHVQDCSVCVSYDPNSCKECNSGFTDTSSGGCVANNTMTTHDFTWIIVGVGVGSLCLCGVCIVVWWLYKKNKKARDAVPGAQPQGPAFGDAEVPPGSILYATPVTQSQGPAFAPPSADFQP